MYEQVFNNLVFHSAATFAAKITLKDVPGSAIPNATIHLIQIAGNVIMHTEDDKMQCIIDTEFGHIVSTERLYDCDISALVLAISRFSFSSDNKLTYIRGVNPTGTGINWLPLFIKSYAVKV